MKLLLNNKNNGKHIPKASSSGYNSTAVGVWAFAGWLQPFKKLQKVISLGSGMVYVSVQLLNQDF